MAFVNLWKSNPWEGHIISLPSLMTNNKTWVQFLKSKDQTLEAFKNFKATIENETRRRINALKFDNGKNTLPNDFAIMSKWKKWWIEWTHLNKMELSKKKTNLSWKWLNALLYNRLTNDLDDYLLCKKCV